VTIAFAGDVHFSGSLAPRPEHPSTAMGPLSRALARADLAMVNLETAVTTRGYPLSKEYRFRALPWHGYGLGNFEFYSAGGLSGQTGLLTLTVDGRKVTRPTWTPGTISSGLPIPLTGSAPRRRSTAGAA
jgi:hypothetical protein